MTDDVNDYLSQIEQWQIIARVGLNSTNPTVVSARDAFLNAIKLAHAEEIGTAVDAALSRDILYLLREP